MSIKSVKSSEKSQLSSRTSSLHSMSASCVDTSKTIADSFLLLDRACRAEFDRSYDEAVKCFIDAGEQLTNVGSTSATQENKCIQKLLTDKAAQVIQWAEQLSAWVSSGSEGSPPSRSGIGFDIALDVNTIPEDGSQFAFLETEVNRLHYTPVSTVNPVNFTRDNYRLQCIQNRRSPKMLIVITMYNEDEIELAQTLRKCCNNVDYLQRHKLPGYTGKDAWKNIVICVVSDGRTKANPNTLKFLSELGLYNEDALTILSTGIQTELHLFERTVFVNTHVNDRIRNFFGIENRTYPPMQILFALKEKNAGKLNSHLWFYNAFAEQVVPEYTVLIDVGTLPTKRSFYKLLSAMEVDRKVGGCCGEIAVNKPIPQLLNVVVAAQHYEYKISNILDKATESCYGFISVLPGAFSAYRYSAIRGPPLEAYFKSLTTSMGKLGPFLGNMYLAEDRVLCFELLARKNCCWKMLYVKDAIARTDVPTNLVDLIAQRRRWLNGSFFATLFVISQWGRVYTQTRHSIIRKFFLLFQLADMAIQTGFNWFLLGNFHLTVYYLIFYNLRENDLYFDNKTFYEDYGGLCEIIFNVVYGVVLALQVIFGLGNKPKHVRHTYKFIGFLLTLAVIVATVFSILAIVNGDLSNINIYIIILAAATFGVFFIASFFHCELHHILISFIQYHLMLPTFINLLMIYSFCNLQDLSWGTKGIESGHESTEMKRLHTTGGYQSLVALKKAEEEKEKLKAAEEDSTKRRFDSFRSNLLIIWLMSNISLSAVVILWVSTEIYLKIVFILIAIINVKRLVGSTIFLIYTARQWFLLQLCLCCGCLKRRHRRNEEQNSARQANMPMENSSPRASYQQV